VLAQVNAAPDGSMSPGSPKELGQWMCHMFLPLKVLELVLGGLGPGMFEHQMFLVLRVLLEQVLGIPKSFDLGTLVLALKVLEQVLGSPKGSKGPDQWIVRTFEHRLGPGTVWTFEHQEFLALKALGQVIGSPQGLDPLTMEPLVSLALKILEQMLGNPKELSLWPRILGHPRFLAQEILEQLLESPKGFDRWMFEHPMSLVPKILQWLLESPKGFGP
jgi:hypothetical protein